MKGRMSGWVLKNFFKTKVHRRYVAEKGLAPSHLWARYE